jgi:protein ImuB
VWLAIYIPHLPLQAVSHALRDSTPVVVFERNQSRDVIIACNREAARLGIKTGRTLAEANTLSDRLVSLCRNHEQEAQRLHQLAIAFSMLTPNVHVSADFGLLLDVSASITLFGGEQSLLDHAVVIIENELIRAHLVLAPTARGARWLARAHRQLIVSGPITPWLDDLPLYCMDVAAELIKDLRELNLHYLSALRHLSTHDLNRRFGAELTQALDHAYGLAEQTLPLWQSPAFFRQYVEFIDLTREQDQWMPGVIVLLQQLQGHLLQHAQVATSIQFFFYQGHQQRTALALIAEQGLHLVEDWLRLFKARIERQLITHEISSIELLCYQITDATYVNTDFFDRSLTHLREWQSLLTLLGSRFGQHEFQNSPRCNHNALPESVSTSTSEIKTNEANDELRPVWLVDPPRQLRGELLHELRSSIKIQQPERIEADWLTQTAINMPQRDYYIAKTATKSIWWVFRDRVTRQWFLQGIFA